MTARNNSIHLLRVPPRHAALHFIIAHHNVIRRATEQTKNQNLHHIAFDSFASADNLRNADGSARLLQIRNYPLFLRECARVLRRNGMIILAEADSQPLTDNKRIMAPEYAQGWTAFWTEYRKTLGKNGFDVSIPTRLRGLLQEIPSLRDNVVAQEALVPIGQCDLRYRTGGTRD